MSIKTAGIWGAILTVIALVIALLKQLTSLIALIISFIGFLTTAVQILLVVVFVSIFVGVGLLIFRKLSGKKDSKND